MSYSEDYRKRTIEYRGEGHTLEETHKIFKVSISTIRKWEKQWKEKGTLSPAPVVRKYKKIEPERLKTYVQEHPDAYPGEIAKEFNCCETAIRKALKRLGITRKKRQPNTRNKIQKKERPTRKRSQKSLQNKLLMSMKPGLTHICTGNTGTRPGDKRCVLQSVAASISELEWLRPNLAGGLSHHLSIPVQ